MEELSFQGRIAYRKNQFEEGRPTLVFIHGLSGSASAWFSYELLLGAKCNLLTMDLRGHGKSSKPRRYADYALKESAADIYELLNYLNIEKCTLVSHSYGTLVALKLLALHQERISKTIFLSPTAFLEKTRWSFFVRTLGRALAVVFDIFPFSPAIRGRVDYSLYKPTSDWDLRRVSRDVYATNIRVYLYCLVQAYLENCDKMWGEIGIPTLIMHGTADSYIPVSHAVWLSKEVPASKLVLLKQADHIIVLNDAVEISKQIEAFVI